MDPRHRYETLVGTEIHCTEWGDPDAPALVCVHGLSRHGRDFDFLAEALADEYRVLCPDMPGRGESEWNPAVYDPESMVRVLVEFHEALDLDSVRYLGLSMGGSLGLALVAGPLADRVEQLVLVDVGPNPAGDEDAEAGVDRIVEYLTNPPAFDRLTELEGYFREIYETFPEMTDDEWRHLTRTSARRRDDGQWTPAYDTRIVEPVVRGEAADGWALWDAIEVPALVVRGAESDILSADTVEEMVERRPGTETHVVEDCGHAPVFNTEDQVAPVRRFLN